MTLGGMRRCSGGSVPLAGLLILAMALGTTDGQAAGERAGVRVHQVQAKVVDAQSGQALDDAKVTLVWGRRVGKTLQEYGRANLKTGRAGQVRKRIVSRRSITAYRLTAVKSGYKAFEQTWKASGRRGPMRTLPLTRTGEITIEVFDADRPSRKIFGASVKRDDHMPPLESGKKGLIVVSGLSEDTHTLTVSKEGFEDTILKNVQIDTKEPKRLRVFLHPLTLPEPVQFETEAVFDVKRGSIHASRHNGFYNKYAPKKNIPYKLYIPQDGQELSDKRIVKWPLDVIILSHGAGQNREIATGCKSGGKYIDGLATIWAKQGYLVVCPTYRAMRYGPFGIRYWEPALNHDDILRVVTDMIDSGNKHGGDFYTHRVRDLLFIRTHLHDVLGERYKLAYDEEKSQVGLAGHSLGGITTLAAAGVPIPLGKGTLKLEDRTCTPEGECFKRNADHAFVDADAYLLLCASGAGVPPSSLYVIDPLRPCLTGRNYVDEDLLVMTGTRDNVFKDHYYDPVVLAHGLHDEPAFGMVIDGANHITPVTSFGGVPSWSFTGDFMAILADVQRGCRKAEKDWKSVEELLKAEASLGIFTQEHRQFMRDKPKKLEKLLDEVGRLFPHPKEASSKTGQMRKGCSGGINKKSELRRLDTFKANTLAFWDMALAGGTPDPATCLVALQAYQPCDCMVCPSAFNPTTLADRVYETDAKKIPIAQFQDDGNVLLLKNGADVQEGALIPPVTDTDRHVIPSQGRVMSKIDGHSGILYLRGHCKPNQEEEDMPAVSEGLYVYPPGDKPAVLIDRSGNLWMRGDVFTSDDVGNGLN